MSHIKFVLIIMMLFCTQTVNALPKERTTPIKTALNANDWDAASDLAADLVEAVSVVE